MCSFSTNVVELTVPKAELEETTTNISCLMNLNIAVEEKLAPHPFYPLILKY